MLTGMRQEPRVPKPTIPTLSGRLHALREILGHLNASLTSLNESHRFVDTQVRDLETYISGLTITPPD